jgi:flagellar hook protein FlgE
MGLSTALTTALTGLVAAETKIDVVGNNLANLQTVGFKESDTVFATQFYRTYSFGTSSTEGGAQLSTNPQQIGLGTQVAAITPNFGQGAIELSSSPTDLAIQGSGFFIVNGANGEQLYTRSGIFTVSSNNQLVTPTGNRLLGYGVDSEHRIQRTNLTPITIPFGERADAVATQNVYFEGNLTPTGDVATAGEVIESAVLGNGLIPRANTTGTTLLEAEIPDVSATTATGAVGGTLTPGATYSYKIVYEDSAGTETAPSVNIDITLGAGENQVNLANVPSPTGDYNNVRIYRTAADGSDFFFLEEFAAGPTSYVDDGTPALSATELNETLLDSNYTYMVTFGGPGLEESRPSPILGPLRIENGRLQINDLPDIPTGPNIPAWTQVNIYRNLGSDPESFFLVGSGSPTQSFTDGRSDADISDLTISGNKAIDMIGPKANLNTRLVDIVTQNGFEFETVFKEGDLNFTYSKGGRAGASGDFELGSTSTIQDLLLFMEDSMGIFKPGDDLANPIPVSQNNIIGESGVLVPGGSLVDGKLRIVSNNGLVNALELAQRSMSLTVAATGQLESASLGFHSVQDAVGIGAASDLTAYDSLGVPIDVRITTVLEQRTDGATVYRWFAESKDNLPLTGRNIEVGTGLITLDSEGNFVSASNDQVSIDRRGFPSTSPLDFTLDFSNLTGLASGESVMNVESQDGSPAGALTNYVISEDGLVQGIYSNGTTRNLGKIQLAVFSNPEGLDQRADNLFASGANSGLTYVDPGAQGAGQLISGAIEQSNTDIGRNLIDLSLATTLYRSNSRVISTSQTLLDELLNLRR